MNEKLISCCVLARNEERSIRKAILSLERQILPEGYRSEVIVVVNGSTDRTAQIVKEMHQGYKNIKLIEVQEAGKINAWNIAKNNAKGNLLVFSDADIVTNRTAIREIAAEFGRRPKIKAVSAKRRPIIKGRTAKIFGLHEQTNPVSISGAFYAVKKDSVQSISIPRHIISDDKYLSVRIGFDKIGVCNNAIVFVKIPTNMRDWLNQKARVEAGWIQLKRELKIKTPSRMGRLKEVYSTLTPKERLTKLPLWMSLIGLARIKGEIDARKKKIPWKRVRTAKI